VTGPVREAALLPGETALVEGSVRRAGGHFESERYTGGAAVKVTGDGTGVAGHAGVLLLAEMADRVDLTGRLVGGDGAHPPAPLGA
jgi:hypothetical protein